MRNWANEEFDRYCRVVSEGIFCQFCGAELTDECEDLTIENKPYEIWEGGNSKCVHQADLT